MQAPWLIAMLLVVVVTMGGGVESPKDVFFPSPSPPHLCVYHEGGLHITMRTPSGSRLRTEIYFAGRTHEEVSYDIERSYRWWATQAGKMGAEYFVREAQMQGVYIELGRNIPGDPVAPIKKVHINRSCW